MKKIIATLLIALVAFTAFAATSTDNQSLTVKLAVNAINDIAFTTAQATTDNSTTELANKISTTEYTIDTSDMGLTDDVTIYASALTNSKDKFTLKLKFTPLRKDGNSTTDVIGLTINEVTASTSDNSIDLSEQNAESGLRTISKQLNISAVQADYEKAVQGNYSATLTLTVSSN